MNKKMLMIIAAVIVVGGAAGAFFMMGGKEQPAGGGEKVVAPAAPPGIVSLDPFLVNINDNGKDRFAKLSVRLTVAPASAALSATEDDLVQAKMRDRVLTLLSNKTVEDLTAPVGKEAFRREIKAHLDPLIEKGSVQEVLFADFVVQ